jgi:hypothetical protein
MKPFMAFLSVFIVVAGIVTVVYMTQQDDKPLEEMQQSMETIADDAGSAMDISVNSEPASESLEEASNNVGQAFENAGESMSNAVENAGVQLEGSYNSDNFNAEAKAAS